MIIEVLCSKIQVLRVVDKHIGDRLEVKDSKEENEMNIVDPFPTSSELMNVLKSKNTSQVAEIVNGVFSADTVTANYVQFWFRRFRSGIFDVKDAPRTGRPVVENVDKITEIIEVDWRVSSRSFAQELKIDYTTKPFE
ncbi:histone-lysine N-methyltransferase SETMAR [Trichonephila clavipes]|nr:histone-lysine N-methyltransferase SETMAR [Trichonephila clavipes]